MSGIRLRVVCVSAGVWYVVEVVFASLEFKWIYWVCKRIVLWFDIGANSSKRSNILRKRLNESGPMASFPIQCVRFANQL